MNQAKSYDRYLTVSEVAAMFQVSPKTIVRWANEHKLPYMTTLGGHRRFPKDKVEEVRAHLEFSMEEE